MENLVQTLTECNKDDHVLFGCCANCEPGMPSDMWAGYDDYLKTYDSEQVYVTPEMLKINCNCKDADCHQCAMIELGADYGQRRFKSHIDYTPCSCPCHWASAVA